MVILLASNIASDETAHNGLLHHDLEIVLSSVHSQYDFLMLGKAFFETLKNPI